MVTKHKNRNRPNKSKKKGNAADTVPDIGSLKLNEDENGLPTEVLGVVAGFLAGIHAFGTLANLNIANLALRAETTPVLYETFLGDNLHNLPHYRDRGIPKLKAFKYTKFYICRDEIQTLSVKERSTTFPNLVMTIENVRSPDAGGYSVHLSLHRSITTATAFGNILHTPIHHAPFLHTQCRSAEHVLRFGAEYDRRACEEEDAKPLVRVPETLAEIYLVPGAQLLPDKQPGLKWTTQIRLHDTEFAKPDWFNEDQGPMETLFELLKLAPRDETHAREFDARLEKPQSCLCRHVYKQWHIDLVFLPKGFEKFANMLLRLLDQNPKVMLNRLKMLIMFQPSRENFRQVCDRFLPYLVSDNESENYSFGLGPTRVVVALASCFDPRAPMPTRHVGFIRVKSIENGLTTFHDNVFTEGARPGLPLKDDMDFGSCWTYYETMPSDLPTRVNPYIGR